MKQQLLDLIKGYEWYFPEQLAEKYPRVLQKIIDQWFKEESLKAYLNELMLMDRHDKQGVPANIMSEIFNLSQVYDKLTSNGCLKKTDVWEHVEK